VEVEGAGGFEDAAEFDQARGHHGQVGHHVVAAQEGEKRLHHVADLAGLPGHFLINAGGGGIPVPGVLKALIWLAAAVPSFSWKKALSSWAEFKGGSR